MTRIRDNLLLGASIASIGFIQWFFAYREPAVAVALALFLIIVFYILASLVRSFSRSLEVLALALIYTLLTASLPWFFLRQEFLLPTVYSLILLLCLWYMHQRAIPLGELGLGRGNTGRYLLVGLLLAVPLGIAEYLILLPPPSFPSFRWLGLGRDLLYMFLFVAVAEEVLFRGLIQRELVRNLGGRLGLAWAAILFMFMHFTWRSIPELGFTLAAGLILGYFYLRTGSLTGPIVLHGASNLLLVGIFPYLLG